MHEIITLQLGQRSNYLATHFWNTQESYFTYSADQESLIDHDVHFRPGIGADGAETFTPRTLIYDLKGGFGSMRKINALYEVEEPAYPQGLWNGPTVVQTEAPINQNEYQRNLEQGLPTPQLTPESIKYWSDFNRVFYHPRSIVQLNEFELNSTIMPFEIWNVGEELFNLLDKEHDLLDRDLRYFAEEADQMQGIQLMTGLDDAWGGFAARYLDRIRDEYGKTSVLLWGMEDNMKSVPREKRSLTLSNTARSITEMASQSSMFVPLTVPTVVPAYVTLNPNSRWQVSALIAAAMESMSLPSRLKPQNSARQTFDQLSNMLNINGNQTIAKLGMGVNYETTVNGHSHTDGLGREIESNDLRIKCDVDDWDLHEEDTPSELHIQLFPEEADGDTRGRRTKKTHVFGQAEVSRDDDDQEKEIAMYNEGNEQAGRRAAGLPIIQRLKIPVLFPLLDSFPHIFVQESVTPTPLSLSTTLSSDTSVALRIQTLQQVVNRAIGVDEREALSNSLGEIAEAYEEGWDSGSDDDDDD